MASAALTPGRDLDWAEALAGAEPADCVPVAATDPLYILYTSGTTAKPKGVVRDNGGHAVALRWSMDNVYDTGPGEVFWAASDVGWVVGHSYIVYAPLLAGCTTVLYEGKPVGTPDAGAFWRVIAEHGVKALFTAPTAFRAIKKEDPDGELARRYDLSGLQVPVPGRRAARPGDLPVGPRAARRSGHRPLVADRDRLADRGRPDGPGGPADQARIAHRADARLRRPHPRRRRRRVAARRERRDRAADAAAARMPAHAVARRRPVRRVVPVAAPRFLRHRRRRVPRRGRLPVRDGPHRRRDQRRRAPAVHRGDGGGARQPPRRGRMRGDRGQRRVQGPGPARLRRAQGGRQRRARRPCPPSSSSWSATGSGRSPRCAGSTWFAALPKTRSGKILRKTMRGIADGKDEPVPSTIENVAVLDALRPVLASSVPRQISQ